MDNHLMVVMETRKHQYQTNKNTTYIKSHKLAGYETFDESHHDLSKLNLFKCPYELRVEQKHPHGFASSYNL